MGAVEVSQKVLEIAKEGGYFEGDIPTTEGELAAQAMYFADEAKKAWDEGMRDKFVGRILITTGELSEEDYNAAIESAPEELETPVARQPVEETYPRRSSGGYSESDLREPSSAPEPENAAEAFMRKKGLPIPQGSAERPQLPENLVELDDREVRKYHGIYNALLGRARWLLGISNADLANATYMRDEAFRVALLKVDRIDPETDKIKNVGMVEAEAKDDPDYQMWAERVNHHNKDVAIRKSVVDIYQGNVDRLSREWTMRTEEFERSR